MNDFIKARYWKPDRQSLSCWVRKSSFAQKQDASLLPSSAHHANRANRTCAHKLAAFGFSGKVGGGPLLALTARKLSLLLNGVSRQGETEPPLD
jgi:hypothetical protein